MHVAGLSKKVKLGGCKAQGCFVAMSAAMEEVSLREWGQHLERRREGVRPCAALDYILPKTQLQLSSPCTDRSLSINVSISLTLLDPFTCFLVWVDLQSTLWDKDSSASGLFGKGS